MVRQCNVTLNNKAVTVVQFGDISVQLPAIGVDAERIWVAYEDGKYFCVDENYVSAKSKDENNIQPKRKATKKTTMEKNTLVNDDVDLSEQQDL